MTSLSFDYIPKLSGRLVSKTRNSVRTHKLLDHGKAEALISKYIKTNQNSKTKTLEAELLWQLFFQHKTCNSLYTFIYFDEKLLSIFEDPNDILLFKNPAGLSSSLSFFCNDYNRAQLLQRFNPTQLFKILNTNGSTNTLEILIKTDHWIKLTEIYKLDVNTIVKIASQNGARQVLEALLDSDTWKTLTEVYKLNINDITKIVAHNGGKKVLDLLLDSDTWKTLTKVYKFDVDSIIKIANFAGSRKVFTILLDPKKWKTLTQTYKLDTFHIVKITSSNGSSKVLEYLLNHDNWIKLTQTCGFDTASIIKIASNGGTQDVFDIFLDKDHWHTLTDVYQFDIESIVKIANHNGSKNVFMLLLDKKNGKTLRDVLGFDSETIIKIASHEGSKNVLDLLLTADKWKTLTEIYKLKPENIIKIVNSSGATNVLTTLLSHKTWKILTEDYKFDPDSIVKISGHSGSKKILDFFLNPHNWKTLTQVYKFDINQLIKMANSDGATTVFNILIDSKKWKTLTEIYNFDLNSIVRIANHNGSSQVLDILLCDHNWSTLTNTYHLNINDIIKIAAHRGAKQVFNLLLNLENWTTLTDVYKLDTNSIVKIANHDDSGIIFTTLLKQSNWKILTENYKFDRNGIVKILNHKNSRHALNHLLNPENLKIFTSTYKLGSDNIAKILNINGTIDNLNLLFSVKHWDFLTEICNFDIPSILEILCYKNAKTVINIFINPQKWNYLTQEIGLDMPTLTLIAKQHNANFVLDFFLTPNKYNEFTTLLGKDMLIKFASSPQTSWQLDTFLHQTKDFQLIFNNTWMHKILRLPIKDQKGLHTLCTSTIKHPHHFSQKYIFILSKISGRHLPHIFNMIYSHSKHVQSLFSGYGLPFLDETDQQAHNLSKPLTTFGLQILTLAELHHYCLDSPLSIKDLKFLKDSLPPNLSNSERMLCLKRLIYITSNALSNNRIPIWQNLLEYNWVSNESWYLWLSKLPPQIREWFILYGFNHIHTILNHGTPPPELMLKGQQFLPFCLKQAPLRAYLQQYFNETLSAPPTLLKHNYTIFQTANNQSRLSMDKNRPITLFDWIHLSLTIYTFIDSIMITLNNIPTSSEVKNSVPHDFFPLKNGYPTFFLHQGDFYTSLHHKQLSTILFEISKLDTSISKNNRKRPNTCLALPRPKKSCMTTTPYKNSIEHSSFSAFSLLNDSDWQHILTHMDESQESPTNYFNDMTLDSFETDDQMDDYPLMDMYHNFTP